MIIKHWLSGFFTVLILFLVNHNEILKELMADKDVSKVLKKNITPYWTGILILSCFSWLFVIYEAYNALSKGKDGGLTIFKFLFKK